MKATSTSSKSTRRPASKASRLSTISSQGQLDLRLPSVTASTESQPTARRKPSGGSTRKSGDDKATQTLEIVLKRLKVSKVRCVDVETSGLDWKRNAIVGYVVSFSGDPRDSYYVPFRHAGNANVGGREGLKGEHAWDNNIGICMGEYELIKALDEPGTIMFGHNMAFDLKFIRRASYDGEYAFDFRPRFEDTMINACLINELQGKFSLEFCAGISGVQAKKSAQIVDYLCSKFSEAAAKPKSAMGHYWRLAGDDPMAVEYACGDGVTTFQLRDKQTLEIQKQELTKVWDIESRLIPVLARMSTRGIRIDEERLSKLATFIKQQVGDGSDAYPGELMKQFWNEGAPKDFNVWSSTDVKWWMEQHGNINWPRTAPSKTFPSGQPSFRKEWLEESDAGKQILEVRELETLGSTFVNPMRTEHLWHGRVHTNYNQLRTDEFGTITGRLSCDSPNLQAVPKHNYRQGKLFRSIFVPDEGMTWASADYSQLEPRLLAYYSRARALLDGYNANPPVDAHTVASMMSNSNWDKMDATERKKYRDNFGKRINQTILTGGGKKVLVDKYKIPADKVDEVWNNYHRRLPEIKTIQKKMELRMKQRGYLLTLLERRCRLQSPDRAYVALSRALQGGNADVLKVKLVECDEYLASVGRPVDILNNIHDDLAFQFLEENRKHYEECLRIMQSFGSNDLIQLDVPITVDAGEGSNWAEATYGH